MKPLRYLMMSVFTIVAALTPVAAQSLTKDQRSEVNQMIADYLKNNPEALAAALDNMQDYYRNQAQQLETRAIADNRDQIISDPRDPRFGPANAPNVIVEFFDYNCGYCKRNYAAIQDLMNSRKDVLFIFKELPILSPTSEKAARMALSIDNPDDYQRFHAALMKNAGTLDAAALSSITVSLGLDEKKLSTLGKRASITDHLEDTKKLAGTLGISGTPSFYINGKIYKGLQSAEDLKAILAQ